MRSSAVSGSSFSKISFFAAPSASLRGLKGLGGFTATVRVAGRLKQSTESALIQVFQGSRARIALEFVKNCFVDRRSIFQVLDHDSVERGASDEAITDCFGCDQDCLS